MQDWAMRLGAAGGWWLGLEAIYEMEARKVGMVVGVSSGEFLVETMGKLLIAQWKDMVRGCSEIGNQWMCRTEVIHLDRKEGETGKGCCKGGQIEATGRLSCHIDACRVSGRGSE